MADTQTSPQDNMVWVYAKQARDHAANMTHELAKAITRVETLEATVSQYALTINQLAVAVRKLQAATHR